MKKVIIAMLAITTLSSCGWYRDYNRNQLKLDAEAEGKAILLKAESSKKALIEQAKAENEAAELQAESKVTLAKANAQEEIERAKGVAEANRIIGESLEGNDEYLNYLYIQGLNEGKGERIYIATEAGMPVLEASNNIQKSK